MKKRRSIVNKSKRRKEKWKINIATKKEETNAMKVQEQRRIIYKSGGSNSCISSSTSGSSIYMYL